MPDLLAEALAFASRLSVTYEDSRSRKPYKHQAKVADLVRHLRVLEAASAGRAKSGARSAGDPTGTQHGPMEPSGSRYFKSAKRAVAQSARKQGVMEAVKRERGDAGCEVCGWILQPGDWRVLHAHHVVPVSAGGSGERENLIVLCPNHHAAAHRAGQVIVDRWTGPQTREALLAVLRGN